tara:strand:+ start:117 stop:254 length:138 start_codon:yes stop_codon:yes gene_type:complete
MLFYESRQSKTSPLKYVLELSPEEVEKVKRELFEIINKIKSSENK